MNKKLVFAKKIDNFEFTGLIDISINPPKVFCFCTEETSNEILKMHKQILEQPTLPIIDAIKSLKRYNAQSCAGYEGSGSTWIEIEEEEDGDFIKWEDIEKIIN